MKSLIEWQYDCEPVAFGFDQTAQGPGATVWFTGELRYRDALPGYSVRQPRTDAEIVLNLCETSLNLLDRLEGEFSLVVFDRRTRRLMLRRDALGGRPLFYTRSEQGVAISTRLQCLANLRSAQANESYFAEFLLHANPHAELPTENTAAVGVQRVLPGSEITIDAQSVQFRRFFEWTPLYRNSPASDLIEVSDGFFSCLKEAVRERMRNRRAIVQLSGGLDSAAVAAIAYAESSKISTVSLVYHRGELAAERATIASLNKWFPQGNACFVNGEDALDFERFRQAAPHDEPFAGLQTSHMDQLLLERAAEAGADVMLTGNGSDEIIGWNPLYLADRLCERRMSQVLRETRAWAAALNRGFVSTLFRFALSPILESRPALYPRSAAWSKLKWYDVPPWIDPLFAKAHALAERGRELAKGRNQYPFCKNQQLSILENAAGDWANVHLALPSGRTISHPFLDPRVIRFALEHAQPFRCDPHFRKPVLQTALHRHTNLPAEFIDRKNKIGFTELYRMGLNKHLQDLESLIEQSPLCNGVFDGEVLTRCLREAALGAGNLRSTEGLDKALSLLAWYEQRDQLSKPSSPDAKADHDERQQNNQLDASPPGVVTNC